MKALEQETWPFDRAEDGQPSTAVEQVNDEKSVSTDEQSKPGFFNKLKTKLFPRVWRTA